MVLIKKTVQKIEQPEDHVNGLLQILIKIPKNSHKYLLHWVNLVLEFCEHRRSEVGLTTASQYFQGILCRWGFFKTEI